MCQAFSNGKVAHCLSPYPLQTILRVDIGNLSHCYIELQSSGEDRVAKEVDEC